MLILSLLIVEENLSFSENNSNGWRLLLVGKGRAWGRWWGQDEEEVLLGKGLNVASMVIGHIYLDIQHRLSYEVKGNASFEKNVEVCVIFIINLKLNYVGYYYYF